jgi:hypothetical protein
MLRQGRLPTQIELICQDACHTYYDMSASSNSNKQASGSQSWGQQCKNQENIANNANDLKHQMIIAQEAV